MALGKDSPYTPFLKNTMFNLMESGQLQRITDRYAVKANHICQQSIQETEEDKSVAMSYKKLFTLFAIIGLGMIMGIILLALEIISKRMKLKLKWKYANPKTVTSSTQTNDIELQKQKQIKSKVSRIPRLTTIY